MNYKNMLKHAGMLCEYDDLTRDTSNDYAILDELKKLKDTYLGDDFYWWDGTSDGKTSKDEPLGYWDGRDGTSHYYIRTRYGTQFSIVVDTKQNITIRVYLGNKCYATYNSIDEFEEYLKKRNNARKQKKSITDYDEDQDEWISGAHENESTKIKNKNMTINEAKQLLKKNGYIINEEFELVDTDCEMRTVGDLIEILKRVPSTWEIKIRQGNIDDVNIGMIAQNIDNNGNYKPEIVLFAKEE
jgi:hypothetical protein